MNGSNWPPEMEFTMKSTKGSILFLNFSEATDNSTNYTFPHEVESGLSTAGAIFANDVTISGTAYTAVPAWYDKTHKRLYLSNYSGHYFTVSGKTLTPY